MDIPTPEEVRKDRDVRLEKEKVQINKDKEVLRKCISEKLPKEILKAIDTENQSITINVHVKKYEQNVPVLDLIVEILRPFEKKGWNFALRSRYDLILGCSDVKISPFWFTRTSYPFVLKISNKPFKENDKYLYMTGY